MYQSSVASTTRTRNRLTDASVLDVGRQRPLYVALAEEVAFHALAGMTTHRANVAFTLLGAVQFAALRKDGLRDAHLRASVDLDWLAYTCRRGNVAKVRDDFEALSVVTIASHPPPLRSVRFDANDGTAAVQVHRAYACPRSFLKAPLPLPTGHVQTAQAYLEITRHLHHARERAKPLQLRYVLSENCIAKLNAHFGRFDRGRLARQYDVVVPAGITRESVASSILGGMSCTIGFNF